MEGGGGLEMVGDVERNDAKNDSAQNHRPISSRWWGLGYGVGPANVRSLVLMEVVEPAREDRSE